MLEAMACGVPVAAFPVPGPQDVVTPGSTGALNQNLARAVFDALRLDGEACVEFAQNHSWERSTDRFLSFQRPAFKAPKLTQVDNLKCSPGPVDHFKKPDYRNRKEPRKLPPFRPLT